MSARSALLLATALLVAHPARAAEPAAGEPPAREFPAPTAATAAALWQDFLEHGSPASIDALAVLPEVLDDDGEVDAGRCREHRAGVEHATKVAPVSLGAWYFAQRCAEALADDAWGAAALDAFAALSRHALLTSGTNEWNPPIRVVAAVDIDAFILASGERLLYRYIDLNSLPRWMAYRVALRESDTSVIRRYRFDYLDTIMHLTHEPGWDAPAVRREVVRSWIHAADGDDDATEAGAAWDALAAGDKAATSARLRELARDGNLFATIAFANTCLAREAACATDAVDLLLPLAEIRMPEAMLMLAVANGAGLGTKRDEKAARALVEAAASRLPPGEAEALFVLSWSQRKGAGDVPRWARKAVFEAARAGNSTAVVAYAATSVKRDRVAKDALALLEADYAKHRSAPAAFLLAMNAASLPGGERRFAELLAAAAEAGYAPAYAPMAALLEHGSAGTADEARRWRLEAARSGDVESMRKVGDWYAEGTPARDARSARIWYANAAAQDDSVASLALAKSLVTGGPGLEPDFAAAAAVLKELSARGDAEGRRFYAMLLMNGQGVEKDVGAAEKLLREGDAAGDVQSTAFLGGALASGDAGPGRVAEGLGLLAKAAKAGNGEAMNSLAIARYWGIGTDIDRAAAREWWERAIAAGDDSAYNDYAWHLCTSEHEAFFDGRQGLAKMEALRGRRDLEWQEVDTLAACEAAVGEFERAVATQQQAVASARAAGATAATLAKLDERLVRYRGREREITRANPAAAAASAPVPADAAPAGSDGSP